VSQGRDATEVQAPSYRLQATSFPKTCYPPPLVNPPAPSSPLSAAPPQPSPCRALSKPNPQTSPHDPNRPSYHLLPPHNWMNDPNGPHLLEGQTPPLLSAQSPRRCSGATCTGATPTSAPDMIHWRHRPVALAPQHPAARTSEGCFLPAQRFVLNGVPHLHLHGRAERPARSGPPFATATTSSAKTQNAGHRGKTTTCLHWKKLAEPVIPLPAAPA